MLVQNSFGQEQKMSRKSLTLGASVVTLTLACASYAEAQQNLPTINVGGANKTTRVAPPRARPTGAGQTTNADRVIGAGGQATQGTKLTLGEQLDPDAPKSIWSPTTADGKSAYVEKWQIPSTVASITRKQIETKINIVDPQDAIKYMPSLFVRKRNEGDQFSVLQTRTWGINSAARSLVYADDLLLSPLLQNANSGVASAPRWNLVSPEEIERVDVMYGPYSAQYPGNSMGGVVKYTTRMPEKLTATAKNITELQDYSLWGTNRGYTNNITQVFIGDKINDFSWNIAGNWQHGSQQPLTFVVAPVYGMNYAQLSQYPQAILTQTKFGQPAVMYGSTGNLDVDQVLGKFKGAYDINTTTRATYTFALFSNDSISSAQNYLAGNSNNYWGGKPGSITAANPLGLSGAQAPGYNSLGGSTTALQTFGAGIYRIQEKLMTNAGAIKSNTGGLFDYELSASNFTYLQSNQNSPWSAAYPYGGVTQFGRNIKGGGTYWTNVDANGILRPEGMLSNHYVTFGLHGDQQHLNNPVYWNTSWTGGESTAYGFAQSVASGTTANKALWAQDAIKIDPKTKLTMGIRGESWQASNGINESMPGTIGPGGFGYFGVTAANQAKYRAAMMPTYQPTLYHTRFSPKGSLEYLIDDKWKVTGNIGMANRFPVVGELYNLSFNSSTNSNAIPNPYLSPEVALTKEVVLERSIGEGQSGRVTLFDEEVRDALVQQTSYVNGSSVLSNQWTNISRIRNSGVEVAFNKNNVGIQGMEIMGSATWVNSRIISDPTWAPTTTYKNPWSGNYDSWCFSVAGKNMPYVPEWRGTLAATWRPDDAWTFTLAGRYQSKMWSTLSNNDYATMVYQGFDGFLVADFKTTYKVTDHVQADFGINNLNNYKYVLFHPFPQRTYYGSLKYELGTVKKDEPGIFYLGKANGLPEMYDWVKPVAFSID